MTLTIAAHGKDTANNVFLILGADCRGVVQSQDGTRAELNIMKKIAKLSDHVGILIAGDGHAGNFLVQRFVEEHIGTNIDGVSLVVDEFSNFCRTTLSNLNNVPVNNIPQVVFIVAGLDQQEGVFKKPKIFLLSSSNGFFIGQSPTPYEVQGKPFIAHYKFAKEFEYDENNNTIEGLARFVAQCIYDTHRTDGDVGLPTWIAQITSDGYRELLEGAARELYTPWDIEHARHIARS